MPTGSIPSTSFPVSVSVSVQYNSIGSIGIGGIGGIVLTLESIATRNLESAVSLRVGIFL